MQEIVLSTLAKTWFIDLDGTIVKHNGYLSGEDTLLTGTKGFLDSIPKDDYVVITTAREEKYRDITETFLKKEGIRYDLILFNLPTGERIVINDLKTSGLRMAHSINLVRNEGLKGLEVIIDSDL